MDTSPSERTGSSRITCWGTSFTTVRLAPARQRLAANESFEELLLLSKCDRLGRQPGVPASDLEEALEYLRELAETCGE